MTRQALPSRRQNTTRDLVVGGKIYTLCIGYDEAGAPREVFCDGPKYGSAMQAFIADACIIISLALQHGIPKDELLHSLGQIPAFHGGQQTQTYASPIGAIVDAIEGAGMTVIRPDFEGPLADSNWRSIGELAANLKAEVSNLAANDARKENGKND